MTLQTRSTSPLEAEISAMKSLVEVLKVEGEALTSANIDDFGSILKRKQDSLELSNSLTKSRVKSMVNGGFTVDLHGLVSWVRTQTDRPEAITDGPLASWSELEDLSRTAQELNRINGMLINKRALVVSETLTGIRGGSLNEATYGPNGKKLDAVQSRSLVVG